MSLIRTLPAGPLDIVGDIHGEHAALRALMGHLGYDDRGRHPDGRRLVFVGDYCDRGPDSPGVLALVRRLVEEGRAEAILGNHELNLLLDDAKDGSGWFFADRAARDASRYGPMRACRPAERDALRGFLASLPLGLERADLRVAHAAWLDEPVAALRATSDVLACFRAHEQDSAMRAAARGLATREHAEHVSLRQPLDDAATVPDFLHAHAEWDVLHQMNNPVKVLTSGVERKSAQPFYTSGRWRFAERVAWWDTYDAAPHVVVGHYWRQARPFAAESIGKHDHHLFAASGPADWLGKRRNVFCVDYSAGARAARRHQGLPTDHLRLAALRWPERQLVFDDGETVQTVGG